MDIQRTEIRLGLERMEPLMAALSDPQDSLRFIQIAGTNGKGSVSAFLSEILTRSGYRTGCYTSPAVENVCEQYLINGKPVSEDTLKRWMHRIRAVTRETGWENAEMPTAFETETAAAFCIFKEADCDIVVLETGLGGRDDATNIVRSTIVSVLTSITLDHTGFLGNTVREIASVKAGIIKPGAAAVSTYRNREVSDVFTERCEETGSELIFTEEVKPADIRMEGDRQFFSYKNWERMETGLRGRAQIENAALVLETVGILRSRGFELPEQKVREGLLKTFLPCRLEKIADDPPVFLDGAHNEAAVLRLREYLRQEASSFWDIFIVGMFRDKDYMTVCRLMAGEAEWIITVQTEGNSRALDKEVLRDTFIACGARAVCAESLREAAALALKKAREGGRRGRITAFGSFSFLAALRKELELNIQGNGTERK
ncbi:MAG: bifunctional folylpolyglutamate synthase/dihydrofolate synthase [Lachnospiraceae bacterium]|nr:bifunctional folylpolyglutamate synthase/dihydrofolate synthase [Lachnospiraceae bacterium]